MFFFFMVHKSNVVCFKAIVQQAFCDPSNKIQKEITNQRGECMGQSFHLFVKDESSSFMNTQLQVHLQKNGVSKCDNRTIVEFAHSM